MDIQHYIKNIENNYDAFIENQTEVYTCDRMDDVCDDELYESLSNDYIKKYEPFLILYKKLLLSSEQHKDILFLDSRLTEIKFINSSGYNEDIRAHNNNLQISEIDRAYWNKYNGIFSLTNLTGIPLYDVIYSVYMIKSSKFNNWNESFGSVVGVKLFDLPNYKKKMQVEIEFGFGS